MLWNLMLSPSIMDLCCRHVMLSVVLRGGEEDNTWCWMLQTFIFNIADVEFWCCRHVMLGSWCWMLHATQVAHGRNIVATWGRREIDSSWLNVARNVLATCT
jgi:hypothetical protein